MLRTTAVVQSGTSQWLILIYKDFSVWEMSDSICTCMCVWVSLFKKNKKEKSTMVVTLFCCYWRNVLNNIFSTHWSENIKTLIRCFYFFNFSYTNYTQDLLYEYLLNIYIFFLNSHTLHTHAHKWELIPRPIILGGFIVWKFLRYNRYLREWYFFFFFFLILL